MAQPALVSLVLLPLLSLYLITTVEMIIYVCPWWKRTVVIPILQKGREAPSKCASSVRAQGSQLKAASRENCRKCYFGTEYRALLSG